MPHPGDQELHHLHIPGWHEDSDRAAQSRVQPASEEDLVRWVNHGCWDVWDAAHRSWRKQVEENVRMVSGRQYDAFIEQLGDFVDLSTWFVSADDRWRQTPVFNWLAHYYKLTLSKLTENLPSMGYVPAGADYADAVLAQIMEPVWKYEWEQMEMAEQMFPLYGWVILAARGISKIRWDPDRGPAEDFRGPATLRQGEGEAFSERQLTDAPYARNNEGFFEPAFVRDEQGNLVLGEDGAPQFGDAYSSRLGDLAFDVLVPTSVVVPVGNEPFHRKPWYTETYYMDVEEARRRFGVTDLEPDDLAGEDDLNIKLTYGSNYGMPSSFSTALSLGAVEAAALKGLVRVREHWRREIPNHPKLSRGRVTIVTKDRVLYDDINPFWVEGSREQIVLPYDSFDAVPFPARNEGMGDVEILSPLQRAMNRRMGGAMDAVDYFEQPTEFYNENIISDELADQIGRPGARLPANMIPGLGDPMWRMPAADLPRGSIEMAERLREWMQLLGSQPFGSEGLPVTTDASGELQREVRFDADRVWGATVRLHSYVWARIAKKMGGILAACMTDERLMVLSGEDQAPEFINVAPQMFSGRVHVYPNPESQVLESRQEKQNRIMALVGVGLPIEQALQALNYPDLNRVLRPGGPAYSMAVRENLELMLGQLPPIFPEHDHQTHLLVHRRQMQTVAYRDADPQIQRLFRVHVFIHEQQMLAEQVRQGGLVNEAVAQLAAGADPSQSGAPSAGNVADAASPGDRRAPRGEEIAAGRVTPGAADPRQASIELVS